MSSIPRDAKLEKISLVHGDITDLHVQVVVNAANRQLKGGGGVDGAIHRAAGGKQLLEYNKAKNQSDCPTGSVAPSPGFNLIAKRIYHAVGPRGEKPQLLASCYTKCMDLMKSERYRSIAFPCISTGVFGYPQRAAAEVAILAINKWLADEANFGAVDKIIFCTFTEFDNELYKELLPTLISQS